LTCFTGTKVHILTAGELPVAVNLRRCQYLYFRTSKASKLSTVFSAVAVKHMRSSKPTSVSLALQFTCFTSTKVHVLTYEKLPVAVKQMCISKRTNVRELENEIALMML
jgi:hypothetical protein